MSKRWSYAEDAMLLEFSDAVGADRVASHDLGRPNGEGSKRLAFLISSGAAVSFATAKSWKLDYLLRAGLCKKGGDHEATTRDERDEWAQRAQKWMAQSSPIGGMGGRA